MELILARVLVAMVSFVTNDHPIIVHNICTFWENYIYFSMCDMF